MSSRVCCTGCDFETREFHRRIRIVYRYCGGKEFEARRTKGWCYDCAGYADIEEMDIGRLQRRLEQKERERREGRCRAEELSKGFLGGFSNRSELKGFQYSLRRLDEEIKDLGNLLEIATTRKSRPRCLKCWSDNTSQLDDFRHDCGGELKIIPDLSGPRYYYPVATYVLSNEGELLDEY
jgi:hypothetical protein